MGLFRALGRWAKRFITGENGGFKGLMRQANDGIKSVKEGALGDELATFVNTASALTPMGRASETALKQLEEGDLKGVVDTTKSLINN